MAPNTWTDTAEKDLIWNFIKASNNGKIPKADWNRVHEMMTEMGYNFTINALNQRWSKTIVKNYGQRTNTGGNAGSSASASGSASGPATPTTSRKRAAPGSGNQPSATRTPRGNQAAHAMAAGAMAVDDGQDDDESDLENVKPKVKRTKTSHHALVINGLKGQRIDLTKDAESVNSAQNPRGMPELANPSGIKVEDENDFGRRRDRSMTATPSNSAVYFNAASTIRGLSQERKLTKSG
ncbi:hypothetical protein CDEST_06737 [Colletotrichum destructivum]|uniref:Clr5 domain-containing protein n=1 Tax=Colletotrichum destructivum TaxID=34406 RepID=A0AAX4IE64_9PEZI|nr:hypothetical protein CDEST_06737 [Colletotrichum destructivum]